MGVFGWLAISNQIRNITKSDRKGCVVTPCLVSGFKAALRNEDDGGMNGWIDGQVRR